MAAVCLIPVYALLLVYLARWSLKWLSVCSLRFTGKGVKILVIVLWIFFGASPGIAFLLPAGTGIRRIMEYIGNYWLGIILYMAIVVAVFDLVRVLWKHFRKRTPQSVHLRRNRMLAGVLGLVLIAGISGYGMVNAAIIRTTPYQVSIPKDGGKLSSLKIVLAADLHLGYSVGKTQMRQMVEKINRESPDLVVIAGDVFDNDYEAMDDPEALISILQGIQSKYGVYACYGNHDVSEKILAGFTFDRAGEKKESDPRMDSFLERAGIRLLKEEWELIDGSFYLYGRPDQERPGRGVEVRKTPAEFTAGLDDEKPIVVLDHEPRELQKLADAGVDLDLCGHTHNGQVFPGNVIIKLFWENACGYMQKDGMHNIVTSGVGLFGPNMRVATVPEICIVNVNFSGSPPQK